MNSSAIDKIQHVLSQMHNTLAFRRIWRSISPDDVIKRTQFLANTVPTANLWLRVVPSNPKFKMKSFQFRFNLLLHFGLDDAINNLLGVNENLVCSCSKNVAPQPGQATPATCPANVNHFLNCTRQSAFTARHNKIVAILADATRAAGLQPQIEVMVSRPAFTATTRDKHTSQKRYDVTVAGAADLNVLQLDVSVTSSRQQEEAIAKGGANFPLHAANAKAREKVNDYQNFIVPEDETFMPMIAETSGALHPNFAKFLNAIGSRVDNRPPLDAIWTTPTFAAYWLAITSVTLRAETAQACQRLANAALDLSGEAGTHPARKALGGLSL